MDREILSAWIVVGLVLLLSGGAALAYFSDSESSLGNTLTAGILDILIRDQDEPYKEGSVTATWVAKDVKPGWQDDFKVPFVQLINAFGGNVGNHLEIRDNYTVIEEHPCLESDTDCHTDQHPDEMAKEMLITRCVYKQDESCIDCLTGKRHAGYNPLTGRCAGNVLETRDDWRIDDQNGDGKISFFDLFYDPLDNLPPVPNLSEPKFEMGIQFDPDAGNDFQGDTFNLTMIFTINQVASQ